MGLFDMFKKPKTAEDFYKENQTVILEYVKKMNEMDHLACDTKEFAKKIAIYQKLFETYNDLKAFCSSKEGGQDYIHQKFETDEPHTFGNYFSTMKRYKENYDHANYIFCEVIVGISNMACSGTLLQKDLYDKFSVSKNELKLILDEMEFEKMIHREKQGNTYLIRS